MAGPSTIIKSGMWGITLKVFDYADNNSLTIPHNDDFSWDWGETEDVDVFEAGEHVTTLKGQRSPVTGSFTLNMRADTATASAMFLDVVYYRSYVRTNWTPTNQINGTDFDSYGQKATWTLQVTVPEPSSGAGSTHTTRITKTTFKASAAHGEKITQTINYRGWVFTQT